jgi:putative membrane protein
MGEEGGKTELASERTDLAEDRTVMANERTFAGWLRTGIAAVAVGLGFQALFEKMDPAWVPKAIATAFILIGILVFVLAERNARRVLKRLRPHEVTPVGAPTIRLMATVLSAGAAALIAALWLVRIG